jgi:hydroxypyruvate reductase
MPARGALSADPRRDVLLDLYASACLAVDGRRTVRAALAGRAAPRARTLIAVGKAAGAMALGALDALGPGIERGLVISRPGHLDAELGRWAAIECLEGDHPVPGAASLAAGARLLEFAAATPPGSPVLVLVSGGASSLVEALADGIGAEDLARVNDWGLASDLGIGELNAVRRRLSRLKDGRLAAALAQARAEALLISDVPGDDPAVIGSGLVQAATHAPLPPLPDWVAALLSRAAGLPPGGAMPCRVVATIGDALAAAERAADEAGLSVRRLSPPMSGAATVAASRFAHELALTTADLVVWGGETTVTLPARPGRGGRNQHFALAAAQLIAGHDDLLLLAAGTDGTDGNSSDAGAIVDGATVARGAADDLDAAAALAAADAGRFLEATGDLLHTGPTGTNVGDVVLGLRRAPAAAAGAPAAEPAP